MVMIVVVVAFVDVVVMLTFLKSLRQIASRWPPYSAPFESASDCICTG